MYNPPHFAEADTAKLHDAIDAARLALLVSNGAEGVPDATHLPLLLDRAGNRLIGHLAKANGHLARLRAAGRARAVFTGPEAYVSPSFYATKAEHGRVVPTWNYVAIHAEGPVELVENPDALRAIVTALTEKHEGTRDRPWAVSDAPEDFLRAHMKGIVGVVMRIERLTGKWKMSQNRSQADQDGVRAGLAASDDRRDQDAAAAM